MFSEFMWNEYFRKLYKVNPLCIVGTLGASIYTILYFHRDSLKPLISFVFVDQL